MTVKTRLLKKDLSNLLEEYNLGDLENYKYLEKGVVHTNVFIQTTRGKYVVRLYEGRENEKVINFELKLIKKLDKNNFPVPKPIKNKGGKCITLFNEKYAIIFEFMEGEHVKNHDSKHVKKLGRVIGDLHNITKKYKPEEYKIRETPDVKGIHKLSRDIIKRCKTKNIEEIDEIDRRFREEFKSLDFPKQLPKGTIHGDLLKDNILFSNYKLLAVLDFDDAYYGNLLHDLTTAVLEWCFKGNKIDLNFLGHFIKSYEERRPLTKIEIKYFYDSLKFMSIKFSIYFLIEGCIKGDKKDAKSNMFKKYLNIIKNKEKINEIAKGVNKK